MNEQNENVLNELDDILGTSPADDNELASLVTELAERTAEETAAKKRKDEIKKIILNKMDEIGLTSMTVAGRVLYKTKRTYYGIDQNMVNMAKKWFEDTAPELNIPASDKVQKAVDAWMNEHPDADLPDFITKTERTSLGNRKAQ